MKTKTEVVKVAVGIALLFTGMIVSGGAASQQIGSNVTPSHNVRVHWSTQQEVEKLCGKGVAGCARLANADKPYTEVWAKKPTGWDDYDGLCDLGNVVLHVVDNGTSRTAQAATQIDSRTTLAAVTR